MRPHREALCLHRPYGNCPGCVPCVVGISVAAGGVLTPLSSAISGTFCKPPCWCAACSGGGRYGMYLPPPVCGAAAAAAAAAGGAPSCIDPTEGCCACAGVQAFWFWPGEYPGGALPQLLCGVCDVPYPLPPPTPTRCGACGVAPGTKPPPDSSSALPLIVDIGLPGPTL